MTSRLEVLANRISRVSKLAYGTSVSHTNEVFPIISYFCTAVSSAHRKFIRLTMVDRGSYNTTSKPLPLKQRTASVDGRRDYSTKTWTSLLELLKLREYIVTVDHFSIWRRHLAWAMENGKDLREYMTQRYASSMVFMSLLLSIELGVLFNSAGVTTDVRHALLEERHTSVAFWAGMSIILSAILTLLSLISTFTAWTMVSSVSEENAHCIFRSSIGQYCAELPGRFIVSSIYSFLAWLIMFFFLLLPFGYWSMLLMIIGVGLFVHVITAFSAFGRVIMHTGAMGSQRIFDPTYEAGLLPHTLHDNLLIKARANLSRSTSIRRQYRSRSSPIDCILSQDELSSRLHSERSEPSTPMDDEAAHEAPGRKRTESLVKFSDGYDTQGYPSPLVTQFYPSPLVTTPMNSEVDVGLKTPVSALSNGSLSPQRQRPPRRPQFFATKPSAETGTPFGMSKNVVNTAGSTVADKWLQSSANDDGGGSTETFGRDNTQAASAKVTPGQFGRGELQAASVKVKERISSQFSHLRNSSIGSTLDGTGTLGDSEFDRLFDPERSMSDDDGGDDGGAERKSLLKDDNMERGDYSSFRQPKQRGSEPGQSASTGESGYIDE
jgi:hypothetical protein